jgi:hypothetical protein
MGVTGGSPLGFDVGARGAGGTLKGLDLGVRGMRVGGQRKLKVPPELGYGDRVGGWVGAAGSTGGVGGGWGGGGGPAKDQKRASGLAVAWPGLGLGSGGRSLARDAVTAAGALPCVPRLKRIPPILLPLPAGGGRGAPWGHPGHQR